MPTDEAVKRRRRLYAVAARKSWSPTNLGAALLGQIDAQDRASLTLNTGNVVDTWRDTVAGVDFTAATTVRPTYYPAAYNGRPWVVFDGTDDCLSYAGVPAAWAGSNATEIWAVVNQSALPADTGQRVPFGYGNVANTTRRISRAVTTGVNHLRATAGSGAANASTTDGTDDFSGIHIVRGVFDGTNIQCFADGGAVTAQAAIGLNTATTMSRIGALPAAAAANFWQGGIQCVFVTSLLTAAQADKMWHFLSRRT